ncbi:LysR family transcriptional regulator [Glaciecola sp. 1036]|uniref:LysR family transcriptional regulator n=1 Tax=Alteromonadaceae TaxID=72275 RepID=UPI003CFE3717
MKQLSIDNLRTFVTIADLGSFQKAGDLLGRTQPAISLQMKKLESQLEKKLFTKKGQSYQLNPDGQWLYEQARKILSLNDGIFREFTEHKLSGRLRLGIPSEFASTLLPSIVGEFSQRYPDVSLDVTSALSRQLLSPNFRHQFDLILALIPPELPIEGEVLLKDQLVWVCDSNQAVSKQSINLVVAPDGCVYRSRIIEKLKQQTHAWKITYTNADLYGLIAAMRQGLGITALARSSVPPELSIIKDNRLPQLGQINICLIKQEGQHPQVCETLTGYIRSRIN